jgi:hypothetical protein
VHISSEVTTLLFDTAGLLIPFATGLGVAYKAGAKVRSAENVAEASTWTKRADTTPAACPLNSFTPDTDVVMADGTHKDIDDVDVGDRVLSTDPESGKTEAKRVTKLIEGFGTKTLVDIDVDGTTVTATDHHPFWANNTWTDAIDLKAGDNLRQDNGITTTVDGVNIHIAYNQHVNNLTVADFHTYYVSIGAENVLVHNAGGWRCGDEAFDTVHGRERLAQNGFDETAILNMKASNQVYEQADGAMVYVTQTGSDAFDLVVVSGGRVVTAHRDFTKRGLDGLASNYGWSGWKK